MNICVWALLYEHHEDFSEHFIRNTMIIRVYYHAFIGCHMEFHDRSNIGMKMLDNEASSLKLKDQMFFWETVQLSSGTQYNIQADSTSTQIPKTLIASREFMGLYHLKYQRKFENCILLCLDSITWCVNTDIFTHI